MYYVCAIFYVTALILSHYVTAAIDIQTRFVILLGLASPTASLLSISLHHASEPIETTPDKTPLRIPLSKNP